MLITRYCLFWRKKTFDFSFKLIKFSLLCSWSWSIKIGLIFKCLWLCFCSGSIDQCTFEKQVQVLDLICDFFSYDTVFMGTQLKFYLSIKCPLFILLTNKVTLRSFLIMYYNNDLIWYFFTLTQFLKIIISFFLVCMYAYDDDTYCEVCWFGLLLWVESFLCF